jgi:c(7)-type cytochrome triheme protein
MKQRSVVFLIIWACFLIPAPHEVSGADPENGGGILYTEPVKSVLFTHRSHTEGKGLLCDRCHSGLFEMEALKVQEKKDFNMDSLYRGKYCGTCHNGKQAFASNTQCARCHVRVKGLEPGQKIPQRDIPVYKASEAFGKGERAVTFGHQIHTQAIRCASCHPGIFKAKQGANNVVFADHGGQRYCFTCHDGQKAFSWNNCNRCHAKLPAPQQPVIFGPAEKGVAFRHTTHTKTMQCGSCHLKLFPFKKGSTKVTFASHTEGKACFTCHQEKNGQAFYQDCNRCHTDRKAATSAVGAKTAAAPQAAGAQVQAAAAPRGPGPLTFPGGGAAPVQFLHDRHGSFACDQCHPGIFTMKQGATKMTMAEMYQKKSCGLCHDGEKTFGIMECAKCHRNN